MNFAAAILIALAPQPVPEIPTPHANPAVEQLCPELWFADHHYGLCTYYQS
jgi:hypothetical protein